MLRTFSFAILLLVLPGLSGSAIAQRSLIPLEAGFKSPPKSARPLVFWHWMNGNISKDGIRKDLLDMKRSGIAGVMLFNAALAVPAGPIRFGTPEFYEHVDYALALCDSLGIDFINTNCPGWATSGGPWVDVDRSMKILTWNETESNGGAGKLADISLPDTLQNYYREIAVMAVPSDEDKVIDLRKLATITYSGNAEKMDFSTITDGKEKNGISIPITNAKEYLQFAFKNPVTAGMLNLKLKSGSHIYTLDGRLEYTTDGVNYKLLRPILYYGRISGTGFTIPFPPTTALGFRIFVKSAYRETPITTELAEVSFSTQSRLENFNARIGKSHSNINRKYNDQKTDQAINFKDIIDLTGKTSWQLPAGKWTIIRLGYTSSGHTNHPAPPEATGLEIDKLDPLAVAYHFEKANAAMISLAGKSARKSFNGITIDSYEAGLQNWSHTMQADFAKMNGYELRKYLPILTGRVVGSKDITEAVLWDFRKTIATLLAKNFYGVTKKLANQNGKKLYTEPYGGFFDPFEITENVDVSLGEYWMFFGEDNIKKHASAAHTKGKKIFGAEAYTSLPQYGGYRDYPEYLKGIGDKAFIDGVNLNVLHSYVHQPVETPPGYTLGRYGSHFGRLNTWWKYAPEWIGYLSRVQFLLQQGNFVGDVCVLRQDDLEYLASEFLTAEVKKSMTGYDYDFAAQEDLLKMKWVNGRIQLPHGQQYRVLVLPEAGFMQLKVLRHLQELVRQGAIVIGNMPKAPSGMSSDAERIEFRNIASAMFSGASATAKPFGKGKVYAPGNLNGVLSSNGITPDFRVNGADSLKYIHRLSEDTDIYFVSNQQNATVNPSLGFRVNEKTAELWDPVTGKISAIPGQRSVNGTIDFKLSFAPYQSACIVFRKAVAEKTAHADMRFLTQQSPAHSIIISTAWKLSFNPGEEKITSLTMDTLRSWSTYDDKFIKYYSGTVSYVNNFTAPAVSGGRCILQLEQVNDIAAVRLNGKEVGVIWAKPYTADLSAYLQPGENRLEILVTNRWINRIIGDQQPDAKPVTFSTWKHYAADSALQPAGIMGKVRLLFYKP